MQSKYIRMTLNHDSGDINGEILAGRFAGKTLNQLDLDALLLRVMTEATAMLDAERSTLFLHDSRASELVARVAEGFREDLDRATAQAGRHLSDLLDPGKRLVEVDDRLVVLFHLDGEFFCLDDVWTHDGGPLGEGCLEDHGIACPRHGARFDILYGLAVENGAPLTMIGFGRGLPGQWGRYIVVISVLLFAVSTAISWSYYGDRCANYLFGPKAILPYKLAFCAAHFSGAVLKLATVWALGDIFLGIVTFPNLVALLLLTPVLVKETRDYFTRP